MINKGIGILAPPPYPPSPPTIEGDIFAMAIVLMADNKTYKAVVMESEFLPADEYPCRSFKAVERLFSQKMRAFFTRSEVEPGSGALTKEEIARMLKEGDDK